MDHNRRGLALMLAALLISVLVASVRSCNDSAAERAVKVDAANQALAHSIYESTSPIRDYRILSLDPGGITVEAGPSLTSEDLKTLGRKLTEALYQADHEGLGSELMLVDIKRDGKIVCQAQTSSSGIYVKLR